MTEFQKIFSPTHSTYYSEVLYKNTISLDSNEEDSRTEENSLSEHEYLHSSTCILAQKGD